MRNTFEENFYRSLENIKVKGEYFIKELIFFENVCYVNVLVSVLF